MKTYWDTSAVINAAISPDVMDRLDEGEHVTRLHTLAEFFAIATGRGVRYTEADGQAGLFHLRPDECFEWLKIFADKIQFEGWTKKRFWMDCARHRARESKADTFTITGTRLWR